MDNKNLIIGSIAIIVVTLFALVLFLPKNKNISSSSNISLDDVAVYRHIEKTADTAGYYEPCSLSTEDLVKVRNEFAKIYDVRDSDVVYEQTINGDYKVVVGDEYIAFDKNNNGVMYLGTVNALFKVDSTMYDIVIKSCER